MQKKMIKGGKGNFNVDVSIGDFYNFYKENYKTSKNITRKQYTKITEEINEEIIKLIIFDNFGFRMPCKLGDIRIIKKKPRLWLDKQGELVTNFLPIDYKKTKARKKIVYIFNEHSNGYKCFFKWDKASSTVRNQNSYFIKSLRKYARLLAKAIKSGDSRLDYLELNKK